MLSMQTVAAFSVEPLESGIPSPEPGQALVKLHQVGICASDSQIYHGKHKYMSFPVVQGHEGVGTVQAVDGDLREVRVGDKVCFLPQHACGACHACLAGRENICVNRKGVGVLKSGLFAEYAVCPEDILQVLPADFTDDQGMLVEPATVGVHAAGLAGIGGGDRAIVIGAGIIGNFTAQACRAAGAEVIIADLVDHKLDVARKNGLKNAVNTGRDDLAKAAAGIFGGRETTAVFDCAGVEASLIQAAQLASNGSRVVIVANFKQPVPLEIPLFQRREISIVTAMAATRADFRETVRLMAEGKLSTVDLVSERFPLRELGAAFRYIDDNPGTVIKVAVTM